MANAKTIAIAIKSIEFTNAGELVLVAQPNELNPKGSYVMNAAQEQRLLKRVGIPDAIALKHLIALSNGTSKLSMDVTVMKAGEAWDNGKGGASRKSGIVGEKNGGKDWTRIENHEITLGFAAQMKVAEIALQSAFSNSASIRGGFTARPQPQAQPAGVLATTTEADFMGDAATTTTATTDEDPAV